MKHFKILFIATLFIVGIFCGPKQGNVIRIGLIIPITGDVKTFGESVRNSVLLAVAEANQKGGVNGKLIKIISADDKNDPTEAANAASKLINQDKVKFIIGSVASKSSIPLSEICQQSKVLMITPTSTNPKVTIRDDGTRKDYVFRACFIDPFQGTVAAKFAVEYMKAKKTAVLYDKSNDYSTGLAEFFKDNFIKNGGVVSVYESYGKDDVDFSALLTKVKADNLNILFLPDYYTKVGLITKKARELGITATFLGGDGWDSPEMAKIAGDAIDGGYFTNHYSPQDTRPEVQEWVAKYETKYGSKPDALGTLGYDATNLLLEAIRVAGTDDPTSVRDALTKLSNFPCVSGNITFDAFGNPVKNAVILQYQNGEQKYVATVQP